jgi:hypothetical protein
MKLKHLVRSGMIAVVANFAATSFSYAQNGACCKTDGTCQDVTAGVGECGGLGGFYLGDGTVCAGSDCGRGACATNIGLTGSCFVGCEAACQLVEGKFEGVGTTCGVGGTGIQSPPSPGGGGGVYTSGGQVNISGATLFADFFEFNPAATNDFLNTDGDNIYCRQPLPNGPVTSVDTFNLFKDLDCSPGLDGVDQLMPDWSCPGNLPSWYGHLLVQYRSVGSVEGFDEFVTSQLTGAIPNSIPSERGLIGRTRWATTGAKVGTCQQGDCFGVAGTSDDSGTPVCPNSIDLSSTDVPSSYAVQGPGTQNDARWDRKPTQSGYGRGNIASKPSYPGGTLTEVQAMSSLERPGFGSLNLNTATPDGNTIFDSVVAWSPVAALANRGTGLKNVRFTDLQHMWVTGRARNGENLVVGGRDVGSGTRNTFANGLAIDPGQAIGDNIGKRIDITSDSNVGLSISTSPVSPIRGRRTQPTQCGGSSIMENVVQQWRLAVGYTGLAGASRAAVDQRAGVYEILNVCNDADSDGVEIPGFACVPNNCDNGARNCGGAVPVDSTPANDGYVRAGLDTVLDNSNPLCSYRIGALQTFGSRGDPLSGVGAGPFIPPTGNPPMANFAARDYIRNLLSSIAGFGAAPGVAAGNLMPGQFMAETFFLPLGVDQVQVPLTNPTSLGATPGFSQTLQDFIRCNHLLRPAAEGGSPVLPFGSVNIAGRVPQRNSLAGLITTPPVPPALYTSYSDGNSVNANYDGNGAVTIGVGGTYELASSASLNQRNEISGDFNYSGLRNSSDIPEMMKALANPRQYQADEFAAPLPHLPGTPALPNPNGTMSSNVVVPEIIGDFNGDGNFDAQDIRYFADGLSIDVNTGKLDRNKGWRLVDEWWNYYKSGAGAAFGAIPPRPEYAAATPPWHPTLPSYLPSYADCRVWGAAVADIAGAMPSPGSEPTGQDGAVDALDIDYVYANFGDFHNLRYDATGMDLSADMTGDLVVDQDDVDKVVQCILCTQYGDANLDGFVDSIDEAIVNASIATPPPVASWSNGDFDGSGAVDGTDLAVLTGNLGFSSPCRRVCGDTNCDGDLNGMDIAEFIEAMLSYPGSYCQVAKCTGCVRGNSDINLDSAVDFDDVPVFVNALLAGSCP